MIVTVLKLGVTVTTLAKTGTSQCILRKTQENDSLGSRRRTSVLYDDTLVLLTKSLVHCVVIKL